MGVLRMCIRRQCIVFLMLSVARARETAKTNNENLIKHEHKQNTQHKHIHTTQHQFYFDFIVLGVI